MTVSATLLIGLIGSFLMFLGDMCLYYSKADYQNKDAFHAIIEIMKGVGTKRLYLGGCLGVVAAFLCFIGYYHLVLCCTGAVRPFGWALFFVNALGIVFGGAYHNQCAYFGLIGRLEHQRSLDEVTRYLSFQSKILFVIMGLGSLGQLLIIALQWTMFPRWMALASPFTLTLLTPVVQRLPKGVHMIIAGGWKSLSLVIYNLSAFIWVSQMNVI